MPSQCPTGPPLVMACRSLTRWVHDRRLRHGAPSALPPAERRISRRIAAISESATLAVDAKAKALKAAGKPVIGFGAGEPDFPTPDYIVEAAVAACRQPAMHRYTPAGGLPALKEAIVAKTARDSGLQATPANVLVTNGGKQAVYEAFATMLDPGDEVLVPAPYWTTYPEAIRLAGGVPVPVVADEQSGYLVSVGPARGGADRRAPRCCCSARRRTRPARCTRRSRSRRSAAGRWTPACGC